MATYGNRRDFSERCVVNVPLLKSHPSVCVCVCVCSASLLGITELHSTVTTCSRQARYYSLSDLVVKQREDIRSRCFTRTDIGLRGYKTLLFSTNISLYLRNDRYKIWPLLLNANRN